MRFLALSLIAAAFASVASAKPAVPYNAVHGHKLRPKATKSAANSTATVPNKFAGNLAAASTAFSVSGPKFVTYIDNTVSNASVSLVQY
jgi:hypothetical protein